MDPIFNHYCHVLDSLMEEHTYWKYYFAHPYCRAWSYETDNGIIIATGATRCAIVDPTMDTIVKFDLAGYNGNCKQEEERYLKAEMNGDDKFLCSCRYLGTYTRTIVMPCLQDVEAQVSYSMDIEDWDDLDLDNIPEKEYTISLPLYAYDYAKDFVEFHFETAKTYEDKCRKSTSPLATSDWEVAANFISCWGFQNFIKFSQFCLNNNINDLHSGNVGWCKGKLVVIDYAGFY